MSTPRFHTPYCTARAKTQPSKTRLHPSRLGRAELDELLAELADLDPNDPEEGQA